MNSEDQLAGEKRVRDILIDPLLRLGLSRPTTMKESLFQAMLRELELILAYMAAGNLLALGEWVQAHPGGPNGDRFPIAVKILPEARKLQSPDGGPSRLARNVFAHDLGREAIAQGWAPELLANINAVHKWPGAYTVSQIRAAARDAVRRLDDIDMRLARGDEISADDTAWRTRRRIAIQKCQDIADLAAQGAGK